MRREQPEDRAWDLVTAFYETRRLFLVQYEAYESTVLGLAAERGVDRSQLQLPALEVSQLLDFDKLDHMYHRHLVPLRELSAEVFRDGGQADLFDIYVVDIFHEISILREEHVEVTAYGVQRADVDRGDEEALSRGVLQVLSEVHEYFPKRLHRVHKLFEKAEQRLRTLVGRFADNQVFVRSLYLFSADVLPEGELEAFYRSVYPGGMAEGLVVAARSFRDGGFADLAAEALGRARELLGEEDAELLAEAEALGAQLGV